MQQLQSADVILILILLFIVVMAIVGISLRWMEIGHELHYLNVEICRSDRKEKRYWKRKKIKLILSLFLPLK